MTTVGSGSYQYEVMESWAKLPAGWTFGPVSAVATDSRDRVYAFQRKDPPIIVFDRDGSYLGSWGSSAIKDPHGIAIIDDVSAEIHPGRQAPDGPGHARPGV